MGQRWNRVNAYRSIFPKTNKEYKSLLDKCGNSDKKVAEHLNIPYETFRYIKRDVWWRQKRKNILAIIDEEKVIQMSLDGYSKQYVADYFGVCLKSLQKFLVKHKLDDLIFAKYSITDNFPITKLQYVEKKLENITDALIATGIGTTRSHLVHWKRAVGLTGVSKSKGRTWYDVYQEEVTETGISNS